MLLKTKSTELYIISTAMITFSIAAYWKQSALWNRKGLACETSCCMVETCYSHDHFKSDSYGLRQKINCLAHVCVLFLKIKSSVPLLWCSYAYFYVGVVYEPNSILEVWGWSNHKGKNPTMGKWVERIWSLRWKSCSKICAGKDSTRQRYPCWVCRYMHTHVETCKLLYLMNYKVPMYFDYSNYIEFASIHIKWAPT